MKFLKRLEEGRIVKRIMVFSFIFLFFNSFGRGKSYYLPCNYYPNKKMDRLYKRYGNIYYRVDGFSCVALSQTNEGVIMFSYDKNRVLDRKILVGRHLKKFNHEATKEE